ncbi:hypothetical protein [uncultured Draconibacterium sp.]|uniref:hypothetical protein n=1 Tax=uncultured Draconibacterium sp. TaxID=1573823 RepID=UPI0029C8EF45|nr:hypothetical protein [uncultured Draconibacterium sp.]
MKKIRLIYLYFSAFSFFSFLLVFADITLPAQEVDRAKIIKKEIQISNGKNYKIKAKGRYEYYEDVNHYFYSIANENDEIIVHLSKYFKEWKSIELIQNEKIITSAIGTDIYYMGAFSLLFLVPLFSFKSVKFLSSRKELMIGIPIIELISLILIIRFLVVQLGMIEKM